MVNCSLNFETAERLLVPSAPPLLPARPNITYLFFPWSALEFPGAVRKKRAFFVREESK